MVRKSRPERDGEADRAEEGPGGAVDRRAPAHRSSARAGPASARPPGSRPNARRRTAAQIGERDEDDDPAWRASRPCRFLRWRRRLERRALRRMSGRVNCPDRAMDHGQSANLLRRFRQRFTGLIRMSRPVHRPICRREGHACFRNSRNSPCGQCRRSRRRRHHRRGLRQDRRLARRRHHHADHRRGHRRPRLLQLFLHAFRHVTATAPRRCEEAGRGARLWQFHHRRDQLRHHRLGAVPGGQGR